MRELSTSQMLAVRRNIVSLSNTGMRSKGVLDFGLFPI
jgi:hypothetical protein